MLGLGRSVWTGTLVLPSPALRYTSSWGLLLDEQRSFCFCSSRIPPVSSSFHLMVHPSLPDGQNTSFTQNSKTIVPYMLRLRRKWSFYTRFMCFACAEV